MASLRRAFFFFFIFFLFVCWVDSENATSPINSTSSAMVMTSEIPQPSQSPEECKSMENGDKLTQSEFMARLVNSCRYDKLLRPGTDGPVSVLARAYIYFMQATDSHDMHFKLHFLLQLRYFDPRLAYKTHSPKRKVIMGEDQLRYNIWTPHVYLSNEQKSSIMGTDSKDTLVSISPEGVVLFSRRIQAVLYCWMNLQKFPFDEQTCSMNLESWMYSSSEVQLHWEDNSPVTVAPELHLAEFALLDRWINETLVNADWGNPRHGGFIGNYSAISFTFKLGRQRGYYLLEYYIPSVMIVAISWVSFWIQADQAPPRIVLVGNYSALSFTFKLGREMGYYFLDYFIPSMMIVAISWVSFWIQADQAPARITLGTSTMLSFITLASAQGKTLPKVSYIKASEVWFLGCTAFIFGSLVEFAFVNIIWRRKKNVEMKKVTGMTILKSTLTPRLARKELAQTQGSLSKSHSCSSLDGTSDQPKGGPFNNYLTVNSLSATLPTITTQSYDDLASSNNSHGSGVVTITVDGEQDRPKPNTWTTMTPQDISRWIDTRSRLLFPLAFLVFNIIYFSFVYFL